jgi:hypothetical protein
MAGACDADRARAEFNLKVLKRFDAAIEEVSWLLLHLVLRSKYLCGPAVSCRKAVHGVTNIILYDKWPELMIRFLPHKAVLILVAPLQILASVGHVALYDLNVNDSKWV